MVVREHDHEVLIALDVTGFNKLLADLRVVSDDRIDKRKQFLAIGFFIHAIQNLQGVLDEFGAAIGVKLQYVTSRRHFTEVKELTSLDGLQIFPPFFSHRLNCCEVEIATALAQGSNRRHTLTTHYFEKNWQIKTR